MKKLLIIWVAILILIIAHTIGKCCIMYMDHEHRRMIRYLNEAVKSAYDAGYQAAIQKEYIHYDR
jgi:cell division protein FtsW (lipid II flippase)